MARAKASREYLAVTCNLACASPSRSDGPTRAERIASAMQWAAETRRAGVDLVFAQEIPGDEWLHAWKRNYEIVTVERPRYRVRSALLVSRSLRCDLYPLPTVRYHDSYVAAASIVLPGIGPLVALSVHASPAVITDRYWTDWKASNLEPPIGRGTDVPWDSDALLATVRWVASTGPVLVAGDWNEARDWDDTRPHSATGTEFFTRAEQEDLLRDVTYRAWKKEVPTHRIGNKDSLQLDHIFVTPGIAKHLHVDSPAQALGPWGASDHRSISFTIKWRRTVRAFPTRRVQERALRV